MPKNSLRFKVFSRDRFTCVYCGRSAPHVILECDHKEPKSKGGPDTLENLVTSCKDCNRGKSARLLTVEPRSIEDAPTVGAAKVAPEVQSLPSALVGMFGHTFESCKECGKPRVQYQVKVLAQIADGVFLVQLYDWFLGDPTLAKAYTVEDMHAGGWAFYATRDDWTWEYEHHLYPAHEPCQEAEYTRFRSAATAKANHLRVERA